MYIYELTMCEGKYECAYILHNKKYTQEEFRIIYAKAYKIVENKIKNLGGYYTEDGWEFLMDVMREEFGFIIADFAFVAEIADDMEISDPCIAETCIFMNNYDMEQKQPIPQPTAVEKRAVQEKIDRICKIDIK